MVIDLQLLSSFSGQLNVQCNNIGLENKAGLCFQKSTDQALPNSSLINYYVLVKLIPYSGKLSREKTFTNFAIFQPSSKVFSMKF